MVTSTNHLQALLPEPSGLQLEQVDKRDNLIYIVVSTMLPRVPCPECNTSSSRIHSRYQRILRDLPWQGTIVRLKLLCRRFYCQSVDCIRKIFTERLPKVVRHYGRQTERLQDTLAILGHALGGEAGLRLAARIGLESSADSILRSIKKLIPEPAPAVRVLGVDDWAWKKGQRYGTILVDLERRCPVDLLPDRSASSFEDWLLRHPCIEIIARDRASLYSQGAAAGAPDAVQVADRFHLLCNLTAAVDELAALNALPQLHSALTRQRKSDNPIVLGFQGMSQLDAIYGKKAETILSQAYTNIVLRTREPKAAEHLSKLIGSAQLERVTESRPAHWFGSHQRHSYSAQRVVDPVVMSAEIQGLPDLSGYFVQESKVVPIQFHPRPRRVRAEGLIERAIPTARIRPSAVEAEPDADLNAVSTQGGISTGATLFKEQ